MRLHGIPLVPAVIGLILGPLSEQQFRRAVAISEEDTQVFVTRPISAVLLFLALAVLVAPRLLERWIPGVRKPDDGYKRPAPRRQGLFRGRATTRSKTRRSPPHGTERAG